MKITKIIFFLFLSFSLKSIAEQPAWELVSMNPPRGTVRSITISYDNKILIGSEGGAFFSNDNGSIWNKIFDGYTSRIVVSQEEIIFILHEYLISSYLKFSTNYGKSWNKINKDGCCWINNDNNRILMSFLENDSNGLLQYCYYLYDNDTNLKRVCVMPSSLIEFNYASKTYFKDSLIFQSTFDNNYHVYLVGTSDFGRTWTKIKLPLNESIYDFVISSNHVFYATSENGIYISGDLGKNWKQIWLKERDVYSLLFVNNDIILAAAKDGLYYSLNGGKEWMFSELNEQLNNTYRLSYALASDSSINIYSSPYKLGVYKSDAQCKDWQEVNMGFSAIPAKDIIFNGNEIYISCWGVFKSIDSGKSFKYLDLKTYDVGPLNINSKGTILAGTDAYVTSDGFFLSRDAGKTWENTDNLFSVRGIALNSKDHIFISPSARSTDGGNTWIDLDIDASYIAVNDEDHVFGFISGGIYRSIDDGVSWDKVAEAKNTGGSESGGRIIFNNKTKTAAYYGLVTTDNGRTWFKQEEEAYSLYSTSAGVYAIDSLGCWVRTYNVKIDQYDYYLYRSCDNGKTWQRMDTTGFRHSKFETLGCSPDGHIYVFGSTGGLYRSRDRFVSVEENMKISHNQNELLSSDIYEIEVRERELFGRDKSIKIYNTLGECVINDSIDAEMMYYGGTKQVNISSLNPGVYFISYGKVKKSFVKVE